MSDVIEPGLAQESRALTIGALPPAADPAPLGLAGFALTTFLLSASNAQLTHGTSAWLGYAFAYGGLAQLLAGMWEFRNRNVFGACAFSSYGAFWIGLGLYIELDAPTATKATQVSNDLGWILLAFLIFTSYMTLCTLYATKAVLLVFVLLEVTFAVLMIGNFDNSTGIIKVGGYVGIVLAAAAWYASAAGVVNGMNPGRKPVLPVGSPVLTAVI